MSKYLVNIFYLIGSICFLIGTLLSIYIQFKGE
jgi:hypothetical protein